MLTNVIQEMYSPFCENSMDLIMLDTRDAAYVATIVDTVSKIEKLERT